MENIKGIFLESNDKNLTLKVIDFLNENGFFCISVNILKGKKDEELKEIIKRIKPLNHYIINIGNETLNIKELNVKNINNYSNEEELMEEVLMCLI